MNICTTKLQEDLFPSIKPGTEYGNTCSRAFSSAASRPLLIPPFPNRSPPLQSPLSHPDPLPLIRRHDRKHAALPAHAAQLLGGLFQLFPQLARRLRINLPHGKIAARLLQLASHDAARLQIQGDIPSGLNAPLRLSSRNSAELVRYNWLDSPATTVAVLLRSGKRKITSLPSCGKKESGYLPFHSAVSCDSITRRPRKKINPGAFHAPGFIESITTGKRINLFPRPFCL